MLYIVWTSVAALLVAAVAWNILNHPLRGFPGPPIAALTGLYATYWDVIKYGRLLEHVTELHKQYGPVVRIGPNELSFCDPKGFIDVYTSKFAKGKQFYKAFGLSDSVVGTIEFSHWRVARDRLNKFFSRRVTLNLENVVQTTIDKFVGRLQSEGADGSPVNLFLAFRCATLDIISAYSLDEPLGALDVPGFKYAFVVNTQKALVAVKVFIYVPLLYLFHSIPSSWAFAPDDDLSAEPPSTAGFMGRLKGMLHMHARVDRLVDNMMANPALARSQDRETIFSHLLEIPNMTRSILRQEATALLVAGGDTTAITCNVGVVHVLSNPAILQRLTTELYVAWPELTAPVGYTTLEKLPYLTAVIKESLRHSHGAVSLLPRVVGPGPAMIGRFSVPEGTVVKSSSTFVHYNAEIFPEPETFNPERWLAPNAHQTLDPWLVAFSKGPRICQGINLAWMELYLLFGYVFRKLDLQLHDSMVDDFKEFDDFLIAVYRGKPLQVTITPRTM